MHEVIIDDSSLDEDKESDDEGDDEGDEDDESDESDDEMPALLEEESDNDLGEAEQISESDGSKSSNVSIVEPQVFADSGSMADRAHMLGVPTRSFRKIKRFGLPLVFCSVLWWLARSPEITQQHDLRLAEYFAGVKSVTRGCRAEGIPAASYELNDADTDEAWCGPHNWHGALSLGDPSNGGLQYVIPGYL